MNTKLLISIVIFLVIAALAACAPAPVTEITEVTLMLDYVPNTNHTGIYVAQANGYFSEYGLKVNIVQPGEVLAEPAVATGVADFGVSFQEQITLARSGDAPLPLVSIAAIIQHNTSGFASLAEKNVVSAKGFEGLRYGAFGSPFEAPTLRVLMECAGGDFGKVDIVETGFADPLALLSTQQIDLAWIFYGWQGIQAQQQGTDLNVVMMSDHFDCIPDYYTPVLITSEKMIAERPEIVRNFLKAISRGYQFAIDYPDQAATILLAAVPELDEELVRNSQAWLSPRYRANAPRWGEQQLSVWQGYSQWMADYDIIAAPIDAQAAFTNDFLP